MSSISSPNMGLQIPIVGSQPGPLYATDIDNSLSLIDEHNHTSGQGVQIPTAGLSLDADLTINGFGLFDALRLGLAPQLSPLSGVTYPANLYVSGVDLYYNDNNGNQIQMTAAGQVNSAAGSIAGLSAPALAAYSSGSEKFIWQANSGNQTPADMDFGSAIIREHVPAGHSVTLSAFTGLAADYTITLPNSLPGSDLPVFLDSSGQLSSNQIGTAALATNAVTTPKITDGAILTAKIADGQVTNAKLAPVNYASTSVPNVQATSSTFVSLGTVAPTLDGSRPVMIQLIPDGSGSVGFLNLTSSVPLTASKRLTGTIQVEGSNGYISAQELQYYTAIATGGDTPQILIPCSSLTFIDFSFTAGVVTYNMKINAVSSFTLTQVANSILIAREL